jgi:hypothetical protein
MVDWFDNAPHALLLEGAEYDLGTCRNLGAVERTAFDDGCMGRMSCMVWAVDDLHGTPGSIRFGFYSFYPCGCL